VFGAGIAALFLAVHLKRSRLPMPVDPSGDRPAIKAGRASRVGVAAARAAENQ
jgi:hypothetical protein